MSYNGYGMESQYAMSHAEYMNNPAHGYGGLAGYEPRKANVRRAVQSYGSYGNYGSADPVLSTATRRTNTAKTTELQNLLIAAGFGSYLGSYGADGDFYTATRNAVQAFQRAKNIAVTGTATQETWNALRAHVGQTNATQAAESAGTAPASPSSGGGVGSWQEGLGTFASGLGQGIAAMFGGGAASAGTIATPGSGTAIATVPPAAKPKWPMYVAIGVGLIAVGGGVYFMTKKKKGRK